MRIAFISTMNTAPWGGSELLWLAAARRARDAGHEVFASVCRWPQTPQPLAALEESGVQVVYRTRWDEMMRPLARRAFHRCFGRRVFRPERYWRDLLAFRPDVVCLSQGSALDFLWSPDGLIRLLEESQIPLVVVSHSDSDRRLLDDTERAAAARFLACVEVAAFVADRTREITERQLGTAIANAVIVRNPVNLANREPLAWPVGDEVRMACVGRLEWSKGWSVLLETLAAPSRRTRPWRLNFFGDLHEISPAYFRALTEYYDLADRVAHRGHVADVRQIWADHHLLVLPSRQESAPLVLVEAMVCGRPAVATDVGGVSEWLADGETGFLAAAATPRALGQALDRAWHAQGQWPDMGQRAREKALAQIGADPAQRFVELIVRAASRRVVR